NINRGATNETKTERDNFVRLSPDEKAHLFRNGLRDATKKFLRQGLKFHRRSLVDLEIKRINRVNVRRDIVHDFHLDFGRSFRFPELSAQTLAADITERLHV